MAHELEIDLQHILLHTQSVWPKLAGANILLTGGTGFVGSWLIESFLFANQQLPLNSRLFVLTRNPQAYPEVRPNLEVLVGDLKAFDFPSEPFHYVIHAAIEHESLTLDANAAILANRRGTERLLQIAKLHRTRRLLLTSSGAIYGEQPLNLNRIPEDYTGRPRGSYAVAKIDAERKITQSGTDSVIARLFAFVGPYLPTDRRFAVGNFIKDAAAGGPIRVEGDGTPLRSYLYAADLAIWLWTLLVKGESRRSYNVGSDQVVSILELAQTVQRVCGVTSAISIARESTPGSPPKRYIPSIERAGSELGLRPLIPLDEGIARMFGWHKAKSYTSTK